MSKFIDQLNELEQEFMAKAKSYTEALDMNSFSLDICNGYLSFRIEGSNENDDSVVISQEICQDHEGNLYGLYVEYND